ncbi:major facilitator superfamily domain-containing protein [Aspergillus pseudotamarii]|uniref:Major facilitator superfamily domain-containing protein n=1 Tax=Aspergillus pseudotamarii TaxID=132259 RepID=A0A5N6T2G8_ASPPS|nr:major facilitator superfamily domain-containing protein [Aspergillus pseudotamarii]KAE8140490.1 major facilitator superfamily domain-containing protein [Aspergillus pseudotamarii]
MSQIGTEKSDTLDTKACDLAPQHPDIALGTLHGTTEDAPYTEAENRTVLRKIDWFLLPWLMGTYLIQFLDKTCISYAALWGMKEEARLVGDQYSFVWAVPFFLFAAPSPTAAKWLSSVEKDVAIKRVSENKTGLDNKEFKFYQAREAFIDPQVWILILFVIANNIPNGGISAFRPLIIEGFGYSKLGTTLLGMPFGGAQVLALLITGFLAGKIKNCRIILMCGGLVVSILGMSLMYALPEENKLGRLFGYYLAIGFSATYVLSLGLIQANIAGRTKKTVVTAALFIAYCVGNLIGPQLFFEREEPHYRSGFIAMIICLALDFILLVILHRLYVLKNRKRDASQSSLEVNIDDTSGLTDLTDMENPSFRYVV